MYENEAKTQKLVFWLLIVTYFKQLKRHLEILSNEFSTY